MPEDLGYVIIGRRWFREFNQYVEIERKKIRCDCGEELILENFTNTCPRCDADYNSGGQLLAPRSQWGEETGETLADILSVDTTGHSFE